MFLILASQPKPYPWGSRGGISKFIGSANSDALEGELWFGNHVESGCIVITPQGGVSFSAWLSDEEEDFPLLLKILAVSEPLSIQVHPDMQQARRGFEQEGRLGIHLADPQRNYKDTSPSETIKIPRPNLSCLLPCPMIFLRSGALFLGHSLKPA